MSLYVCQNVALLTRNTVISVILGGHFKTMLSAVGVSLLFGSHAVTRSPVGSTCSTCHHPGPSERVAPPPTLSVSGKVPALAPLGCLLPGVPATPAPRFSLCRGLIPRAPSLCPTSFFPPLNSPCGNTESEFCLSWVDPDCDHTWACS